MSTSTLQPITSTPLDPSEKEKLLSALEANNFQSALQIIPKNGSFEIRVGPNGLTPLHYACMHGRADIATRLIDEYNCKIDTKSQCGHSFTPMHFAAKYGHVDIIELLFSKCQMEKPSAADITVPPSSLDHDGNTPLHTAAIHGQLTAVKCLTNKYSINDPNNSGHIPLYLAVKYGHLNVVKYLVASGSEVPPRASDVHSKTTLHLATGSDQVSDESPPHTANQESHINFLTEEQKTEPSCPIANENNLLCIAAFYGQLAVLKFLIKEKQCNSMPEGQHGKTPLHAACQGGHINVVEYLIDAQKADPSCRDAVGNTPLHFAAICGQLAVVTFLIDEKRCNPMCKGQNGETPLHAACRKGHINVIKYFVDNQKADPSCGDADGNTPLHFAAAFGHLAVVKFLIEEKQCDPMCKDQSGRTPLHVASEKGHINVVKYLIDEQTADPSCRDADGNTPLHYAAVLGHLAVVRFLIEEKHCDPSITDSLWFSPVDLAILNGSMDTALYLISKGGTMRKTQFRNTSPLQDWNPLYPIVKICVVGDMSSGKSTLIKALQEVLQFKTVYGNYFRAGITAKYVATEINSNGWGKITIYNFAGDRQFHASHEALLGNITEAVMLITVDLRKSEEEIKRTVAYWQLLLANAAFASGCYCVILVGTHADTLQDFEFQKKDDLLAGITMASPDYKGLKYVGSVSLNCHKPFFYNKQIQELLETNIKLVRIHLEFDYKNGSNLWAFIRSKLNSVVACSYDFLMAHILQSNNPELESLESSPTLFNACEGLNASGHLVFLKNKENPGESLVILNKQPSLIFHGAIKDMIKECSTAEGMIKQSSLMSILDKIFNQAQAFIDSAIRYMLAMSFSCEVTAQLCLDFTSPSPGEKYFFFPDLVSKEKPVNVCQPSASFTSYFEWSLKCIKRGPNDYHFFTPRFVQLLLINLIRHFGLTPSQDYSKDQYRLQGCKLDVWRSGICWMDASGIKTIVEVAEQSTSVNVIMGSIRGSGIMCHEVLLQEIISIKESACPEVETEAYTTFVSYSYWH